MAALFLLLAALVLRRGGVGPFVAPETLGTAWVVGLTLLGTLGTALAALAVGRLPWNRPGAEAPAAPDAWSRSARRMRWVHAIACAALATAILGIGWFDVVRRELGDLILVDEGVTLLPAVAALVLAWWGHAAHVSTSWRGRLAFTTTQARVQLPLLLVPIALVLGAQEAVERLLPVRGTMQEILGGAAAVTALLLSPALVVPALGTARLPDAGGLRERIEGFFALHRIRLRGVRLWRTGDTLMNGLALGLLPFCRWVLLTDALVATLPPEGSLAVAAHEAAHLRHRHMLWLAGSLVGGFGCFAIAAGALVEALHAASIEIGAVAEWTASIAVVVGGFAFFGVISRACERQADAWAAAALSEGDRVTEAGAGAMGRALAVVAFANGIPPRRPSFRHGSMAGRRRRLAGLVGESIASLPIDRQMRLLKALVIAAVVVTLGAALVEWLGAPTIDGTSIMARTDRP